MKAKSLGVLALMPLFTLAQPVLAGESERIVLQLEQLEGVTAAGMAMAKGLADASGFEMTTSTVNVLSSVQEGDGVEFQTTSVPSIEALAFVEGAAAGMDPGQALADGTAATQATGDMEVMVQTLLGVMAVPGGAVSQATTSGMSVGVLGMGASTVSQATSSALIGGGS